MRGAGVGLAVLLAAIFPARSQEPEPPAVRAVPVTSEVFEAADARALERYVADPGVVRRMVDALVCRVAGAQEVGDAWRRLVRPGERIGIKVGVGAAPLGGVHVEVVEAILAGMERGGIARGSVVVWDRDEAALKRAGMTPARLRCRVAWIPADGSGFDEKHFFTAPILGSLIHGDLLFPRTRGADRGSPDNLSNRSHLSRLLVSDLDRVVQVAPVTHSRLTGVAGALAGMTVPNVDNWRRFFQGGRAGDPFIPEIYSDPAVGGRVVLHFLDGLIVQYAGGPEFDPNHAVHHGALYASVDPVALDGVALARINEYRVATKFPLVGADARHLVTAEEMGLGNLNPRAVRLVGVR